MKAQLIAVTTGLLACASLACTKLLDVKPSSPSSPVALPISSTEIAKPVLQAMQRTQETAPARDAERQKAFDAQRAQFEPVAKALHESVKAGGVDVRCARRTFSAIASCGDAEPEQRERWVAEPGTAHGEPR